MSNDDSSEAVHTFAKLALVPFTGILGTGTILGLRSTLVHGEFSRWVFYATVALWGVSAISGVLLRGRRYLSRDARLDGPAAVIMLIGFIGGLIGSGILCTLRNW